MAPIVFAGTLIPRRAPPNRMNHMNRMPRTRAGLAPGPHLCTKISISPR
ncbi:hypothetical protein [Corynebacterium silvaticum]|uniref:Uncharacterized protein n=1 Tax=Corynebacterium silvaticum TaxID=2320431 RepID=A0ACD4PZC0_9CORY|nr:hypothetical protein [Corynebacterium silvaticum]MBH5299728.1 hypothetical protein [Corynebacterium silvaticum]NOM63953.1 hypothetical protein [Corynebacterium silvaticum]NON70999.1 hypothetical protein [Corynebacterium silvaticum]UWG99799.1 hypothetical protein K1I39_08830 [Corynebacterium silvaticum]UWH03441.1 hypothetical protein K1I38_08845 [Corynebacterium silvaticum]